MNFFSLSDIKKLLRKHGLRPSKRLGQNFLVSQKVLDEILRAADLSEQDVALEVGAGLGTLTKALAEKAKRVIAVEKDPGLISILNKNLDGLDNVEILQGDVLSLLNAKGKRQKAKLQGKIQNWEPKKNNYKVVANIPYYLTSRLIRLLLENPHPPRLIVLMVQKEVAQRIVAKPPKMNLLALAVQFYARPEIAAFVPKNAFWPQPEVDSAILRLELGIRNNELGKKKNRTFFRIVKAGFSQPRKKLVNNLSKKLGVEKQKVLAWLKRCKIEETVRPENLGLADWISLTKNLADDAD